MSINVRIDELVVVGLRIPPGQEPRLRSVVEHEVARLIARDGLAARHRVAGDLPALRAGSIATPRTPDAATLGRHVSRAVARGLSR